MPYEVYAGLMHLISNVGRVEGNYTETDRQGDRAMHHLIQSLGMEG